MVGAAMICPHMDEFHGSVLTSDVVSVFLGQLAPGASNVVYPLSMHPQYCLEPGGAGPVRSTLAQCGNMTRSVWSLACIGYVWLTFSGSVGGCLSVLSLYSSCLTAYLLL